MKQPSCLFPTGFTLVFLYFLLKCSLGELISGDNLDFLQGLLKAGENCTVAKNTSCPRKDVTFWLYKRSNQNNPIKMDQYNLNSLANVSFDNAPFQFLIHGYNGNRSTQINAILRPAYFAVGNYNVISVDWSSLSIKPCYYQAVQNIPIVSECVAQFFNALLKYVDISRIHLQGHSLGAHVAARVSQLSVQRVHNLTRYDIAYPLIPMPVQGIAKIDVCLISNGFLYGNPGPGCRVNLYANNGICQPGCSSTDLLCSHLRCLMYYAEGIIYPQRMVAIPCDRPPYFGVGSCPTPTQASITHVGENISESTSGIFTMYTNNQSLFLIDRRDYTDPAKYRSYRLRSSTDCLNVANATTVLNSFVLQII